MVIFRQSRSHALERLLEIKNQAELLFTVIEVRS